MPSSPAPSPNAPRPSSPRSPRKPKSPTVGTAGSGRNFYGGSFTTIYDDPQHRFSAAFTYTEYHGTDLLPFDDCARPGRSPLLH
jgi:hypothetical protein